jgi:hypothetical protein
MRREQRGAGPQRHEHHAVELPPREPRSTRRSSIAPFSVLISDSW